jgi:hypothetical protein
MYSPADFGPGNCFHRAAIKVRQSLCDFVAPALLGVGIDFLVQAFNQTTSKFGPFRFGKLQRVVEQSFCVSRHISASIYSDAIFACRRKRKEDT